jgi:hypothetical protein
MIALFIVTGALGIALLLIADRKTLAQANRHGMYSLIDMEHAVEPSAPEQPPAVAGPERVSQIGLPQVAIGHVPANGHQYTLLAPLWTAERCLLAVRDAHGRLPLELIDVSEQVRAAAARIAQRQDQGAASRAEGRGMPRPNKEPHP